LPNVAGTRTVTLPMVEAKSFTADPSAWSRSSSWCPSVAEVVAVAATCRRPAPTGIPAAAVVGSGASTLSWTGTVDPRTVQE